MVIFYCLWAFELSNSVGGAAAIWYQISMVPFIIAILRFAATIDRGDGGAPDEIALSDRVLQILALVWVLTIVVAVYVVPALAT